MTATFLLAAARSPMRITEPEPKLASICSSAASRAARRGPLPPSSGGGGTPRGLFRFTLPARGQDGEKALTYKLYRQGVSLSGYKEEPPNWPTQLAPELARINQSQSYTSFI